MRERIYVSEKEIRDFRAKQCDAIYETIREFDRKQVDSYAMSYEVVVTNSDRGK